MKLVAKRTTKDRDDYKSMIESQGGTYLGCGIYGYVYKIPNSKNVIKIMGKDDAYISYIKKTMLKKHQNNPWFPKIISIQKFVVSNRKYDKTYFVIEMEKLNHNYSRAERISNALREICYYNTDEPKKKKINTLVSKLRIKKDVKKHADGVVEVLTKLYGSYHTDLHSHNIMFRGKQPVITDPAT